MLERLKRLLEGYPCAMPPHLRGRVHNDWPWPANKILRSANVRGPRCGPGAEGYEAWPPRLVEGHGVARWESDGGDSIIYIPALVGRTVSAGDVYDRVWEAVEMNPGREDFLLRKSVRLYWRPATVWDEPNGDGTFGQRTTGGMYSPSALQKFSRSGWMRAHPKYYTSWHVLRWREFPALIEGRVAEYEAAADTVLFFRTGWRPDHVDCYYNGDLAGVPAPMAGLHWE